MEVIKNKTLLSNGIDYLGNTRTGFLLLYTLLFICCANTQIYGQIVSNDPNTATNSSSEKTMLLDSSNWIASLKVNHQLVDVNTFSTSQPLKLNVQHNSIHLVLNEQMEQGKQPLKYGYYLLDKNDKEIDRVDLGKQTGIYLSALQSGRYQLIPFIKSGEEDILYAKDPLNFWIKLPFYKSWEFILTGIMLLSLMVYAIFYARIKKLNKEIEILKAALSHAKQVTFKENEKEAKDKKIVVSNGNPSKEEIKGLLANAYENGDWKKFKISLDLAFPNFLQNLNRQHPNLSKNEQWLCAFIKLNIGNKSIAELMFVSKRTIESRRYRLKKKLDLDANIDLKEFIANIT